MIICSCVERKIFQDHPGWVLKKFQAGRKEESAVVGDSLGWVPGPEFGWKEVPPNLLIRIIQSKYAFSPDKSWSTAMFCKCFSRKSTSPF